MPQSVNVSGRIVWGHPINAQKKMKDKQPVMKDGQPVMVWAFGLAISKADCNAIYWPVVYREAATLYPSGQFPPKFACKYVDGDGVDDKGKPFSQREGYAGCIVIAVSSEIQPRTYKFNPQSGRYDEFNEIKTGDFVEVALNIVAHPANPQAAGSQAGLYVNPNGINFLGYGAAIISGPDAETLFGTAPKALPPGASAVPLAPSVGMPGTPPAPPTGPPSGGIPLPPQAPSAPGVVPPVPPYAAPPGVPPAPPPPPMTAYPSSPPPPPAAPARDFVAAVAPHAVPPAPPSPPPPPAVDPNAAVIVRYDTATGKPVWRWPDGREALGN